MTSVFLLLYVQRQCCLLQKHSEAMENADLLTQKIVYQSALTDMAFPQNNPLGFEAQALI